MQSYSIVALTNLLRKSISGDFQIFVVSGQGKRAVLIGTVFYRVPGKCKISTQQKIVYLV